MSKRTALYRFWDAEGRLMYIGITDNVKQRWKHHSANKAWWPDVARREVEWHDTRRDADLAERTAIRVEKPMYNWQHATRIPVGGSVSYSVSRRYPVLERREPSIEPDDVPEQADDDPPVSPEWVRLSKLMIADMGR